MDLINESKHDSQLSKVGDLVTLFDGLKIDMTGITPPTIENLPRQSQCVIPCNNLPLGAANNDSNNRSILNGGIRALMRSQGTENTAPSIQRSSSNILHDISYTTSMQQQPTTTTTDNARFIIANGTLGEEISSTTASRLHSELMVPGQNTVTTSTPIRMPSEDYALNRSMGNTISGIYGHSEGILHAGQNLPSSAPPRLTTDDGSVAGRISISNGTPVQSRLSIDSDPRRVNQGANASRVPEETASGAAAGGAAGPEENGQEEPLPAGWDMRFVLNFN